MFGIHISIEQYTTKFGKMNVDFLNFFAAKILRFPVKMPDKSCESCSFYGKIICYENTNTMTLTKTGE